MDEHRRGDSSRSLTMDPHMDDLFTWMWILNESAMFLFVWNSGIKGFQWLIE